jgi:hypothetical protein
VCVRWGHGALGLGEGAGGVGVRLVGLGWGRVLQEGGGNDGRLTVGSDQGGSPEHCQLRSRELDRSAVFWHAIAPDFADQMQRLPLFHFCALACNCLHQFLEPNPRSSESRLWGLHWITSRQFRGNGQ